MLIHENIIHKLDYFIENKKIPNIIFYGKDGAGKKYLLYEFINKIYNNNAEHIKNYVMYVNCGFGKGIRFIREDLKFFAKTNIHNCGEIIKIIVLVNADKLTIDAQSALRRCIELFSHSTRFFIVLKKIIFCSLEGLNTKSIVFFSFFLKTTRDILKIVFILYKHNHIFIFIFYFTLLRNLEYSFSKSLISLFHISFSVVFLTISKSIFFFSSSSLRFFTFSFVKVLICIFNR